jgi:hypothetical protein
METKFKSKRIRSVKGSDLSNETKKCTSKSLGTIPLNWSTFHIHTFQETFSIPSWSLWPHQEEFVLKMNN